MSPSNAQRRTTALAAPRRAAALALLVLAACLASACGGPESAEAEDAADVKGKLQISGAVTGPAQTGTTLTLAGAKSATTQSDAAGRYTFKGLAAGRYTVTAAKPGFDFTALAELTLSTRSVTGQDFRSSASSPGTPSDSEVDFVVNGSFLLLGTLQ